MSSRRRSVHGVSRRTFLGSLGLAAGLSPLLPILNASGQELRFPKRLLLFYSPDGSANSGAERIDWKPQGSETDFTLHEIHQPLDAYKSKLVIPWGLKMSAAGAGEAHAYGMAGLWTASLLSEPTADADFDGGNGHRTGWGSGPSVDQVLAAAFGESLPYQRAVDDADPETPFRTLELGVQCGQPHSVYRMIYKGDAQPLHPETNPESAFERLFATPVGDPEALTRLRTEQGAVLDVLTSDLARLKSRVGSDDYPKIEAHLDGLAAIERRLTTDFNVSCTAPTAPETLSWNDSANFPVATKTMIDLAVHALACDLTRVASVQLSHGFSGIVHDWLGLTMGHHTMSHDETKNWNPELISIDHWYAQQFAYLLSAMEAVPEGDGTLLDNTLVVWGRELGTTSHRMNPMPLVIAGGAQGALQTGRYLDVTDMEHAKLLVSICRLMGMDTQTFGNLQPDSGPLVGLG